eukprot:12911298-Prorocentrum_lima.AAC.1
MLYGGSGIEEVDEETYQAAGGAAGPPRLHNTHDVVKVESWADEREERSAMTPAQACPVGPAPTTPKT